MLKTFFWGGGGSKTRTAKNLEIGKSFFPLPELTQIAKIIAF